MKLVMSPEYRKAFPCVTRWFTTCVNQLQFQAVVGKVELAKEELVAEGAPALPKKEKVRQLSQTEMSCTCWSAVCPYASIVYTVSLLFVFQITILGFICPLFPVINRKRRRSLPRRRRKRRRKRMTRGRSIRSPRKRRRLTPLLLWTKRPSRRSPETHGKR